MNNNENLKVGFVAIIGRSNVGKSTLMNYIIGYKIAIVADKAQTTRNRIQTIYTNDRGQIIFQDTPGLHNPHNELSRKMVNISKKSINDVDIVLWIVDATESLGFQDRQIAKLLQKANKIVILAINKCDKIKKDDVLPVIDSYRKLYEFDEILPISALKGMNIDNLIDILFKYLPFGEKYYDDDTLTDQSIRQIVSEMIREKALYLLKDEIPHGVAVYIDKMKKRKNKNGELTDVEATVVCERKNHKGIIIGKNGTMLKKIGTLARVDIEELLEMKVNLQLFVKVRNDWRNKASYITDFGIYNEDEF